MTPWNEEHAKLLATKWYDHKKLAELGESEGTLLTITRDPRIFETCVPGLVYKKGPFSISEEQSIKDAIERYRVASAFSVLLTSASLRYLRLTGPRAYRR